MADYRFYNGGDKIDSRIPFDNPNNDITTDNIVSYYALKSEAQSFFTAPDSIASGRGRSFSNFDLTIMAKWGQMGVVRVDPNIDPATSATPVAGTDREAKILGDQIFQDYLMQLVQDYVNRVEQAKAQGLTILPAQGYVKHALKKLGMTDPALTVKVAMEKNKASESSSEVAELKAQVTLLMNMLTGKFNEPAKAAAK